MNVDENQRLNVVNTLTKLTVLDDYEEVMKGKQKELNSLKEMGSMAVVKRSEAVGKRTIQTRWVAREKDGRVKSRSILKDYIYVRSAHSPRYFRQHRRRCLCKRC